MQRSVVRENKGYFSDNVKSGRLDEFCMRYLKGSIHHKTLTSIIQLVLVLSHAQAVVERGFSLNDEILIENVKSESLITQRCVKDFMIANNYSSYNVPITKKRMDNVKSSSQRQKAYLEEQKKSIKNLNNQRLRDD